MDIICSVIEEKEGLVITIQWLPLTLHLHVIIGVIIEGALY